MQKIIKKIKKKDEAVAGIVVAVMIVGLVLAVVSIIQTIYIPKWMESREAEHMGVVADQFSNLKSTIDTQIALKQDIPVSSPITLGSRELGFFMSNKAFGRLALISNGWACRIVWTTPFITNTYEDNYGILRYASQNAYFLNQIYNFEIGGIVLNQTEGAVFIIKPEFSVQYNKTTTYIANLSLTCIDLVPNDEKTSISGYGTYPVRTQYMTPTTNTILTDVKTFAVITSFPSIWYTFLNTTLSDENLYKGTDYTITKTSNQVTITFIYSPKLTSVNLDLTKIQIAAQITPGWSN